MLRSLVIRNLLARPSRNGLTVLGMALGIAVLVTFMTFAANLRQELGAAVKLIGGDLIIVQKGLSFPYASSIRESYAATIQQYKGVNKVSPFLLANTRFGGLPVFNLFGIRLEERWSYLAAARVVKGRAVQGEGEMELGVISHGLTGIKVGQNTRLGSGEFTVVGVYETGVAFLDSGGVVTLGDAQKVFNIPGEVSVILVNLKPEAKANQVIEEIERDMADLEVMSVADFLPVPETAHKVETFALLFSVVALVLGNLGSMNNLLMSVSERTWEMGLLRALGWSRLRILGIVLQESLVLSLAAFAVGSLLGIGLIALLSSLPAIKTMVGFSLTGYVFMAALGIALLSGLLGAVLPAYKALRLSPIEALRYE